MHTCLDLNASITQFCDTSTAFKTCINTVQSLRDSAHVHCFCARVCKKHFFEKCHKTFSNKNFPPTSVRVGMAPHASISKIYAGEYRPQQRGRFNGKTNGVEECNFPILRSVDRHRNSVALLKCHLESVVPQLEYHPLLLHHRPGTMGHCSIGSNALL